MRLTLIVAAFLAAGAALAVPAGEAVPTDASQPWLGRASLERAAYPAGDDVLSPAVLLAGTRFEAGAPVPAVLVLRNRSAFSQRLDFRFPSAASRPRNGFPESSPPLWAWAGATTRTFPTCRARTTCWPWRLPGTSPTRATGCW